MDSHGLMYDKPASPAWLVVKLNDKNTYFSVERVVDGDVFIGVIESGQFYGQPIVVRPEQITYA